MRASVPLTFPWLPFTNNPGTSVIWQRARRAFLQGTEDRVTNNLRFASQPSIPKPQFPDAERLQKSRPLGVVCLLHRVPVLEPIKFNGQPRFFAEEIEEVRSGGMLTAEFVGAEPATAQPAPQQLFRPSALLAKGAGVLDRPGGKCSAR